MPKKASSTPKEKTSTDVEAAKLERSPLQEKIAPKVEQLEWDRSKLEVPPQPQNYHDGEDDSPKLISPPVSPTALVSEPTILEIDRQLMDRPYLVGIAGGSASGKTTVTEVIQRHLEYVWGPGKLATFSQDCFYKDLTEEQMRDVASYNFDHPDALDWEESLRVVRELREGATVRVPRYDYTTNRRCPTEQSTKLDGGRLRVVIVEGILLLHLKQMRELLDLRIYVDVPADERLCRRVQRDVAARGRTIEYVLQQYQATVKPSFEAFCEPTKRYADIIMPRGIDNPVGLQVIIGAIERHARPVS